MSIKPYIALIILSLFLLPNDNNFSHRGIIPEAMAQDQHQGGLPGGIAFEGGEGESPETAVIIKGAQNIIVGTAAEYYYLETKYGRQNVKWELLSQNLLHRQGRHFDLLRLRFVDGSPKEVYFDITEFFGKQ
jgi:hypothetical protein